MRKSIWIMTAVLTVFGLASTAWAEDCKDLDTTRDASKAFDCISTYQDRITSLEEQIAKLIDSKTGEPKPIPKHSDALHEGNVDHNHPYSHEEHGHSGFGIPEGIVAAFDRPNGCPSGWTDFEPGAGRMIVGVDGEAFTLPYFAGVPRYQTGGEAVVTLDEKHLPSHRHSLALAALDGATYKRAGTGANSPYFDLRARGNTDLNLQVSNQHEGTLSAGSGEPHNNMPPYVALYICKKEFHEN